MTLGRLATLQEVRTFTAQEPLLASNGHRAILSKHCLAIVSISLVLFGATMTAAAEPQWTRFRGPNGTGVSETATMPATWTKADYRWQVELPGIGFSSPVVWDDRLYLTSTIENEATLVVLCLQAADGSVLWKREVRTSGIRSTRRTAMPVPRRP